MTRSTIFMMTGTKDMGRKFDGSEGLPDLKIGWTIVFPLTRNVGLGDAGIDNVQDDATDSWKSCFEHSNTHTVRTTRS